MNALGLLKTILSLVSILAQYFRDKKLIDAGASAAILKGIRDADSAIKRANAARSKSISMSDDQQNRDH